MDSNNGDILKTLAKLEEDVRTAADNKQAQQQQQQQQQTVAVFGARLDDDVAGELSIKGSSSSGAKEPVNSLSPHHHLRAMRTRALLSLLHRLMITNEDLSSCAV